MKKPKTQKERLIAVLSKKWLTTYEAAVLKITTTLPKRICDLREAGYVVKQEWCTPKGIKAHFKYKIVSAPKEKKVNLI